MKYISILFLFILLFSVPFELSAQIADTTFTCWIEYKNNKDGYSIKFPPDFKKENEIYSSFPTFTFPKNLSWATGFHTEYLKIESGEKVCDYNTFKELEDFKWEDTICLNGQNYSVGKGSDGAAGTIYYSTYFVTKYKGKCYRLIFSRGHSIGGYLGDDENENKKLIEDIEKNDIETLEIAKKILSTLKFTDDN
ncbi:MAG: hypothetical protein NTU73_00225 [Ignavibacteriae bacterium]|nr:hypothetical protein [Ignavibacteriota bacterium]